MEKGGEQIALQKLSDTVKEKIMPVIEIVPIPYDYVNDQQSKTIDEHLANVCDQIDSCWAKAPIFIDLNLNDDATEMSNGDHPITYLLSEASSKNLSLIPVTNDTRSVEYNNAIKQALADNLISQVCITHLSTFNYGPYPIPIKLKISEVYSAHFSVQVLILIQSSFFHFLFQHISKKY
jgi:hypothetical protein